MQLPHIEKQWLTASESARLLGLGESVFDDLVEEGVIPPGEKLSRKTILWPALTIFAVGILLPHLKKLASGQPRQA